MEVARNLKVTGVSANIIARITGFTLEQIAAL